MQLRILARQGSVNACALARRTTAPFGLQSFASFWKFPYILSFAYIPSTQSLKAAKSPLRETGAGILLFAKGAPFAQFTKMSAKDGWAMLLWVHSAFRTFGVSCKSAPPSTVAQLNGLCLLLALQHLTNGCRTMQFRILTRQGSVNACALARCANCINSVVVVIADLRHKLCLQNASVAHCEARYQPVSIHHGHLEAVCCAPLQ